MNPQSGNSWPPTSGPSAPSALANEHLPVQQRPLATYGPSHAIHQAPLSQMGGAPLLAQPGPFYPNQANGRGLPNATALSQVSSLQPARGPLISQQQHSSPSAIPNHQIPASGFALPVLGQAIQQRPSPSSAERERERERERDMERERQRQNEMMTRDYERELEVREQQREQLHREHHQREHNQREHQQQREQHQREQQQEQHRSPHETRAGSIPLQHPVASRVPATLHGPNGLLGPQHPAVAVPSNINPVTLAAPPGPGNIFGNGVQPANEHSPRPFNQHMVQAVMPSQQLLAFGGAAGPQQLPSGMAAISHGQQPILNDALSYLDQVKIRFVDQPDVYNQFLDIMKDFKSQAIDTPGVIDRVSSLFTGNPELIEGFNTFLPPGYRIECGTGDDPNAIRVTTPMGTTVSQMPSTSARLNGVVNGVQAGDHIAPNLSAPTLQAPYSEGNQPSIDWSQQQGNVDSVIPENSLNSNARHVNRSLFSPRTGHMQSNGATFDRDDHFAAAEAASAAHQQEQRGVSHLSNAVSAVSMNGGINRQPLVNGSPSGGQASSLGHGAGLGNIGSTATPGNITPNTQLNLEKRGPVEFNHAIGYVNKIKQRFNQQPEIYKQFLEILQTYQRESKPIQDVYAQVTQLFSSAPDLLEDFKQFLPESAAQAKSQAVARHIAEDAVPTSNVRGDPTYISMAQGKSQTPRSEMKMPPVGNFAPPASAAKDNKKRRGGAGSQITGGAAASDPVSLPTVQSMRNGNLRGNANKRAKIETSKPAAAEAPPVSPSLIPSLPVPMAPTHKSTPTDDINFFERIKKYISNKQTFNEFLKLCNLFSQDLIDKNVLMHKASSFIGSNPELMSYFKNFIRYEGHDEFIENQPKVGVERVVLSNCRGFGPSYRLLPKLEKHRPCSGRDEMCRQVLNDEWVSHPTWASEDSGFTAHRKNQYEDILHRIEEERHDYDYNIEACLRTVQLLGPIAQQLKLMTDEERMDYVLPRGIGGQSETIYARVIKKIYDRTRGQQVIDDMFRKPAAVIPLLLRRLVQIVEEWKASQREWEKVWRDQTNKLFWKALDHQGIGAKGADKRQFQPKALATEIQIRAEEQRRQSISKWNSMPKYQYLFRFDDVEVIYDACHLIMTHIAHNPESSRVDQPRLENFIKTFVPVFFELDADFFQRRMTDVYDVSPPSEEADDEFPAVDDHAAGRGKRTANGRKGKLLREVLERGQSRKPGQSEKEDNGYQMSKEPTPDPVAAEEDGTTSRDTPADQPVRPDSTDRWLEHPSTGNTHNLNHNEPYKRDSFNLYANQTIYCFFRMFQMLYDRLSHLKANEKEVHEMVRRSKMAKPAYEFKLIDKKPSDFFTDVSPNADYYRQMLRLCEEVLRGEFDSNQLEDILRQFYLQSGWQLYNIEKMISAIVKFASQILGGDGKDKSLDIVNLFYKDRKDAETTHQAELTYRKQVDKLVKDGDIFRIRYSLATKEATITIFKKDDKTFEADELAAAARWSYYISSFAMRDLTEGIDLSLLNWPFLKRNLPPMLETEEEYNRVYTPQWNADNLVLRISPNNYHMQYDPLTQDWWVHDDAVRRRGAVGLQEASEERTAKFRENFGQPAKQKWAEGLSEEDVGKIDREFKEWINGGPPDKMDISDPGIS